MIAYLRLQGLVQYKDRIYLLNVILYIGIYNRLKNTDTM